MLAYLHVSKDPVNHEEWVVGESTSVREPLDNSPHKIGPRTLTIVHLYNCGLGRVRDLWIASDRESSTKVPGAKHRKLKHFAYIDFLQILRDAPTCVHLPEAMKKATPLSDITNSFGVPSMGGGQSSSHGAGVSEFFRNHSNVADCGSARPIASRKANDRVKRQKIFRDSLVRQARAASELSGSVMEKISLLKEQAVMALCSLGDDDGLISAEGRKFRTLKRSRDLARFNRDIAAEYSEPSQQQQQSTTSLSFYVSSQESSTSLSSVPSQVITTGTPSTAGDNPNIANLQ